MTWCLDTLILSKTPRQGTRYYLEAGFYYSPIWDKDYPKIQILTIDELLQGKTVDMPPQTQTSVTFARAPRVSKKEGKQLPMG